MEMTDYLIPGLLALTSVFALWKQENSYDLMVQGAREGLKTIAAILPALVVLLSAVQMLKTSGAMELLTQWCSPFFAWVGIPPETAPLVLVRPLSGSAALAVGADLMAAYGVDSDIGRTAAIMLGSTETTFYTISVYFGAAGISKTRYALPAALVADFVGFAAASWTQKLFF